MSKNRLKKSYIVSIILVAVLSACSLGPASPPVAQPPQGETPQSNPTDGPGTVMTPPAAPTPTESAGGETPKILEVVYIKDGDLWLWKEDGTRAALTDFGDVIDMILSEDGSLAIASRGAGDNRIDLWEVQVDGAGQRLLFSADDFEALDFETRGMRPLGVMPSDLQFIPGTHSLAFNTYPIYDMPGSSVLDDLRVLDLNGPVLRTVLPQGEGGRFYFSPDGRQMAVVTPNRISLMGVDGSNSRVVLEYEPVMTYSEHPYYAHPSWSPDSSFLVAAIPPPDPMGPPVLPMTVWRIPTGSEKATQIGKLMVMPLSGDPLFSPDLTRVFYLRENKGPEQGMQDIHIAGIDGSNDLLYHTAYQVQLIGWAESSEQFLYSQADILQRDFRDTKLAELGGGLKSLAPQSAHVIDVEWVDAQRVLYFSIPQTGGFDLQLGFPGGEPILIDSRLAMPIVFDWALVP
jgi:hypothetical protein